LYLRLEKYYKIFELNQNNTNIRLNTLDQGKELSISAIIFV